MKVTIRFKCSLSMWPCPLYKCKFRVTCPLTNIEPTRRHLRCFVVLPLSQYFPFIWSGSASQHIYWQMTENTTYSVLVQSHLTCVFSFSHFKSYLSSKPVVLIGKQGGGGLVVLYQKANVWRAVCLHLCSLSHRVSQFIIKCVCVRAQNLFCPHRYPSMPLWAQRRPSSGVSDLVHVEGDRACCVLRLRCMDTVMGLSEEPLIAQARHSLVKGPV